MTGKQKVVKVIVGIGVEAGKSEKTYLTHEAMLKKPKFLSEVQKLVDKHYSKEELYDLKERKQ